MSTPVRQDSACTAVKLLAWNLTQYRRVLLSDSDVLLRTDPASWMMEQTRRGHYFIAEPEMAGRGYLGLNTHLVYLEPSAPVFELLRTTAVYGNFVRYTSTDQDVVENIFPARRPMPRLPPNTHSKHAGWCHGRTVFACVQQGRSQCDVVAIANDTCCPSGSDRPLPHCCHPRLGCCSPQRAKWIRSCHHSGVAGQQMNRHCAGILRDAQVSSGMGEEPRLVKDLDAVYLRGRYRTREYIS